MSEAEKDTLVTFEERHAFVGSGPTCERVYSDDAHCNLDRGHRMHDVTSYVVACGCVLDRHGRVRESCPQGAVLTTEGAVDMAGVAHRDQVEAGAS